MIFAHVVTQYFNRLLFASVKFKGYNLRNTGGNSYLRLDVELKDIDCIQ
jgi:hypothetical protein